MAFQITQCPSCNSTFNTSPQMLEMAAGKVRCGACLYVFQAREHFVDVDSDEADESVFIGNDPEDFFDPAVFLTRSALQDDQASSGQQELISTASKANPAPLTEPDTELHESEVPERQDPCSEKSKGSEPSISASQTLAEGKFKDPGADALTEGMGFAVADGSKPLNQAIETQNDQAKTEHGYLADETKADPISESETWAGTDTEVGIEAATPASAQRPEDFSLSISFAVQPRPTVLRAETAAAAGAETQDKRDHTEQLDINRNGSASDSDLAEMDLEATIATKTQAAMGFGKEKQDAVAEDNSLIDELPCTTDEAASESAFVEPGLDSTTEFSKNTSILKPGNISAAELAKQDFNELIKDQEFADTVASGFAAEESMDSELDRSIGLQLASVEAESDHLNAFKNGDDGQSQEPLQTSDSTQNIEHDSLELDEEPPEDENWPADFDAESSNSVDPDSEQNDIALSSVTHTAAPLIESTEPTARGATALISGDENETFEIRALDAPPEMEHDNHSDQASADAATQQDQAGNQDSASEVEVETEVSSEDIRARAMRAQLRDDEALEQLPEENLAALKVMATPLELGSVQGRRWRATLGLALLACLMGTGMAAQFLWRHNAVFSQEPMLRPLFASACQILGCGLEPYSNLSAIVSSNLSVRSHPERADAIMVNVEMRNTAHFEQPFPIMVLGFNTASNDLVALREFKPEEYLNSGLRDITQMPVMAPVQIDLALMDPGNDAVNYTLAFRQP
ncbi:MAG: DUF3426 domain-containing protein [Gammaproteobacteria bacterium TMED163]|nr:MAG: DUF3426 domain-containing protein [Gammaproteobacteria bacterium TMED163]